MVKTVHAGSFKFIHNRQYRPMWLIQPMQKPVTPWIIF